MGRKSNRPKGSNVKSMTVVLVLADRNQRQEAYRALRYGSASVRRHFGRFKAHGPVQSCVMAGRVLFDGPEPVVKQIMADLAPHWRQGNANDLSEELAATAERKRYHASRRK